MNFYLKGNNEKNTYKYLKENYYNDEYNAIMSLGSNFIRYLDNSQRYDLIAVASIIVAEYQHKQKSVSDNFLILNALCAELSKILK